MRTFGLVLWPASGWYDVVMRLHFFAFCTLLVGSVALARQEPEPNPLAELVESAEVKTIGSGFVFTEGPLWIRDALLICDLRTSVIYQFVPGETPITAETATKIRPQSGASAGLTLNAAGDLLCAQFNGQVTRAKDGGTSGEFEVLATQSDVGPIKRANDIVVHADGTVYFTDFGAGDVLKIAPDGTCTRVASGLKAPNGLTLSLDQRKLFVAEYGGMSLKVFDVAADGTLSAGREFATLSGEEGGRPDGMKTDEIGNIYSTGPGGIWVFRESGERLGVIAAPGASNFCFGGQDGKSLFITSGKTVGMIRMKVRGATTPKAPSDPQVTP